MKAEHTMLAGRRLNCVCLLLNSVFFFVNLVSDNTSADQTLQEITVSQHIEELPIKALKLQPLHIICVYIYMHIFSE